MFSLTEWIGRYALRTLFGERKERIDYSDRKHFDRWQPEYGPQSTLYLQHNVDAHVPRAIREMRSAVREAELAAQKAKKEAEIVRVSMIETMYDEDGNMRIEYLNEAGLNAWFKAVYNYLKGNGCVDASILKVIEGFMVNDVDHESKRDILAIIVAIIDSAVENSYEDWKDELRFE